MATGGVNAAAIVDIVGVNATLQMAVQSVRRRGRIVIVGIGGGTYPVRYTTIPPGISIDELAEVIALAEAGRLHPRAARFALGDAPDVFGKLRRGEISGRAVLIP